MSKPTDSEEILIQGKVFANYNEFMKFMFSRQQCDDNEEYDSEEDNDEEQIFAINEEIGYKETKSTRNNKEKYDPSQYYAMMSGEIDYSDRILNEYLKFGNNKDLSIAEILEVEDFATLDEGTVSQEHFYEPVSNQETLEEELDDIEDFYRGTSNT